MDRGISWEIVLNIVSQKYIIQVCARSKVLISSQFNRDLRITNRFSSLDLDEDLFLEVSTKKKEAEAVSRMFFVGKKNIFGLVKTRRSGTRNLHTKIEIVGNDVMLSETIKEIKKKTELQNNSEDNLDILEQDWRVLSLSRKKLKKCKTCGNKRRQCVINPTDCKALGLHCHFCLKPGHFPKSSRCKKQREMQCRKRNNVKKRYFTMDQQHITKKNKKLIKKKIEDLEKLTKRSSVIMLAKRCAKKLGTKKWKNNQEEFLAYCCKKIQKLLNLNPIQNQEDMNLIYDILKVYDQMFYSKKDAEDNLTQDERSSVVDPQTIADADDNCQYEDKNNLKASSNKDGDLSKGVIEGNAYKECTILQEIETLSYDDNLIMDNDISISQVNEELDEFYFSDCEEAITKVDYSNEKELIYKDENLVQDSNLLGSEIDDSSVEKLDTNSNYSSEVLSRYTEETVLFDEEDQTFYSDCEESVGDDQDIMKDEEILSNEMDWIKSNNWLIPQIDGLEDEVTDDEAELANLRLYGVKCEEVQIIQMLNFFRSFDLLWRHNEEHQLCNPKSNCFYCHMRSSMLRLTSDRRKGPKVLKMNEIVSQLNQYEEIQQINWRDNMLDLPAFTRNTVSLLNVNTKLHSMFGLPEGQCQKCKMKTRNTDEIVHEVDTKDMMNRDIISMRYVFNLLICKQTRQDCCFKSLQFEESRGKIILMRFSHPVNVKIISTENLGGTNISYTSHIEEQDGGQLLSFFCSEEKMF